MVSVELRTLLRAYAALALAQRGAKLYAGAAPPHPYLAAVINSQKIALLELEGILEKALAENNSGAPPLDADGEGAAFLM